MGNEHEETLDRCIEAARSGRDPQRVLDQHPEVADEIRPLLGIAAEMERLPAPSPSVRGLMRNLARAEVTRHPQQAPKVTLFSRAVLLRAAAMVLVVLILGWGAAATSAQAVPGDVLYPLKRLTEKVRYHLAINQEVKAELHLVFSEERLKEAVKKQSQGEGIDTAVLAAMLDEAKDALAEGRQLPDERRALLVSRATHLARHQHGILQKLKERTPEPERQRLDPYIERCGRRCSWMDQAPSWSQTRKQTRQTRDKPDESQSRPARRWDRWMRNCPW